MLRFHELRKIGDAHRILYFLNESSTVACDMHNCFQVQHNPFCCSQMAVTDNFQNWNGSFVQNSAHINGNGVGIQDVFLDMNHEKSSLDFQSRR